MAETWKKIKTELSGVYQRARNAVTSTVDSVKLKNRIATQKEIIEEAQLEIGRIVVEARRGMTGDMPEQLLLKPEEATRLDELLSAIAACELEIEAMETELSILKQPKTATTTPEEPVAEETASEASDASATEESGEDEK